MKGIWSENAKVPSKTLKKHYLEKVFASRFREMKKPYKTNGKTTFPEVDNSYQKTLSKPRSNEGKCV